MMRPDIVALKNAIKSWQASIDANHEQIDECFVCMYHDRSQLEFCETTILCKRRENAALKCLVKDAEARISLARVAAFDEVGEEHPAHK